MNKKEKPAKRRDRCLASDRTFLEALYEFSRLASDHADEGTRLVAAVSLLEKAIEVFPTHIHGGSVESWNIAEPRLRKFEEKMPVFVCKAHRCLTPFYLSVLLLRKAVDHREERDAYPKSTMWGHFLMGLSRHKVILQADIAGSTGLKEPASAIHSDEEARFLDIRICRAWLTDVRQRHKELLLVLHAATADMCRKMQFRKERPIGKDIFHEFLLSDFMAAYRGTGIERIHDLSMPLVADVDKSEPLTKLLPIVGKLFHAQDQPQQVEAFVRQMILQAVICPSPGSLDAVGFIPDISYRDSETTSEISSTALQIFLPKRLPPRHPVWRAWAAMASLVGREKSVHDFARKKREDVLQDAFRIIRHDLINSARVLSSCDDPKKVGSTLHALQYVMLAAEIHCRDPQSREWCEWREPVTRVSFGRTLEQAWCINGFELTVQDDTMAGLYVDARVFAIAAELARNMVKHSIESPSLKKTGKISIELLPNSKAVGIVAQSCPHTSARFGSLREVLTEDNRLRGVSAIRLFCNDFLPLSDQMDGTRAAELWTFEFVDAERGKVVFRSPRLMNAVREE